MNYKKILALTVCGALLCAGFAGCKKSDNTSETTAEKTTAEQTTAAQTTEQTTEKKLSFEKGKIEGKEYVNESIGIKFTLPEGHRFMTDEEFSKSIGLGADVLMDEKNAEALKNAANARIIPEMATVSPSGANVNVIVENMGMDVDEKTYADITKRQLDAMTNAKITRKDDSKRTVAGIEFYEMSHDIEINGIKQQQMQLIKSMDKKMMIISLTFTSEDALQKMLDGFSAYTK